MDNHELMVPEKKQGTDLWRNIKKVKNKIKKTQVIPEQYRLPEHITPVERYKTETHMGLTSEQVQERIAQGLANEEIEPVSKSRKEIIYSNVFTYFNLIFFVIALMLILVGSFRDLTFLPIITANTLIGIIQELRSKTVLDNLRILNAPKSTVIRDGKEQAVTSDAIVLDDILIFDAGNQIPVDATVEEGVVLVNEALITGEADQIQKSQGDTLLSGSFIVSGRCIAKAEAVGKESYISKLTLEAKDMNDEESSEMIRSLDRLVKIIGVLIIPIAIILFSQQYFINHASMKASVTATAAAIIGMIPEGLYLLASVALAVSVMRLATQKVLVHNMKCIETLARVDVFCVDKTGTITENTMTVKKIMPLHKNENKPLKKNEENIVSTKEQTAAEALKGENVTTTLATEEIAAAEDITEEIAAENVAAEMTAEEKTITETTAAESTAIEIMQAEAENAETEKSETIVESDSETIEVLPEEDIDFTQLEFDSEAAAEMELALGDFAAAMATDNVTMKAIKDAFRKRSGKRPEKVFPFTSETKYSGAVFTDANYVLGAPEFVLGDQYVYYAQQIEFWSRQGYRVLIFARYAGELDGKALTDKCFPMGMLLLANPVRENAKETFTYFANQGVKIKVISGDNPLTVSEVAKEAGIENAEEYVDASTIDNDDELRRAALQYTVFGRVKPDQKRKLIDYLKQAGHTVAMTGDGVNDVLALKNADCSIAIASGSDAAAQVAQLVLLESDFSRMPSVVAEGRRVVNNIERTASLFLVKNIFSLFLSVLSILLMVNYPLAPSQVSLISMFTIGVPAFVLSLENNKDRIQGHFLSNVLFKALPGGLTDFLVVSALYIFCMEFQVSEKDVSTSATIVLAIVGLMILYKIASPMNKYHWILWGCMAAGLVYCMIFVSSIFAITSISKKSMMLLVIFAIITEPTFRYLSAGIKKISDMYANRKKK